METREETKEVNSIMDTKAETTKERRRRMNKIWRKKTLDNYRNRTPEQVLSDRKRLRPNGKKRCTACEAEKNFSEFAPHQSSSDGLSHQCRKCINEYKTKVNNYKKSIKEKSGCQRCGWKGPACALEFAHKDRSTKYRTATGYIMQPSGLPFQKFLQEVPKCDIICSNCHALESYEESQNNLSMKKKTVEERERILPRRQFVLAEKLKRKHCLDCKIQVSNENFVIFDFDHIEKDDKITNVSEMIISSFTLAQIQEEINKCELRCKRCHRIKTKERGYSQIGGQNRINRKRRCARVERKNHNKRQKTMSITNSNPTHPPPIELTQPSESVSKSSESVSK
jgi:hypothetical protein